MSGSLTLAAFIEGICPWQIERHLSQLEMPVRPIIDSREAEPGALFFALVGERVDGHDYVADAFARGAAASVVARDVDVDAPVLDLTTTQPATTPQPPLVIKVDDVLATMQRAARWWREKLNPRVVGVTGSVGKSSTKELAAQVLAQQYRVAYSKGSHNNEIGLPLTLLRMERDCEVVVQEMGMYVPGDIRFLAEIAQPDVGILTNVEPVHAERAGTIEQIALGKRELVEALPPAPEGVAILNYDDARVRAMAEHTQARVFFYGFSPEADLWAGDVEVLGLDGLRLVLHAGAISRQVTTPLLGRHSALTVLRAASVGLVEGMAWDDIVAGIEQSDAALRLVTVAGVNDTLVVDDTYNASPPSALAALDLLSELQGRKIAVLGDMLELGAYEKEGHLQVGCHAAAIVTTLVVVGELGEMIGQGAARCGLTPEQIHAAPDSTTAAAMVRELVQPGDVILVKGSRGVKMERVVEALTTI